MRQRDAKAYACAIIGREAIALPDSAERAIFNHFTGAPFTDGEIDQVRDALRELSEELIERGARLYPPRPTDAVRK